MSCGAWGTGSLARARLLALSMKPGEGRAIVVRCASARSRRARASRRAASSFKRVVSASTVKLSGLPWERSHAHWWLRICSCLRRRSRTRRWMVMAARCMLRSSAATSLSSHCLLRIWATSVAEAIGECRRAATLANAAMLRIFDWIRTAACALVSRRARCAGNDRRTWRWMTRTMRCSVRMRTL